MLGLCRGRAGTGHSCPCEAAWPGLLFCDPGATVTCHPALPAFLPGQRAAGRGWAGGTPGRDPPRPSSTWLGRAARAVSGEGGLQQLSAAAVRPWCGPAGLPFHCLVCVCTNYLLFLQGRRRNILFHILFLVWKRDGS